MNNNFDIDALEELLDESPKHWRRVETKTDDDFVKYKQYTFSKEGKKQLRAARRSKQKRKQFTG